MELFTIDIVRIFNFILIVAFVGVLIWKYILPDIHSTIVAKETGEKKSSLKRQSLEDLLATLNNELLAEQLLHEQLQQKIIAWKTVVEQKKIEKIQCEELLHNDIQKRLKKQAGERLVDVVRRKEIHGIVVSFVADIKIKFCQKETVASFQKKIISHIASEAIKNESSIV